MIATGLFGLSIGFAYWWTYFDFVGQRVPVDDPVVRVRWLFAHLPVTMAIAAAGAAMVSLVEHGGDVATPAETAWLLTGSVAFGLVALIATVQTLQDFVREPAMYLPVTAWMFVAGAVAILLGWLAPAPWILAALLVVTLSVLWFYSVSRRYRLQAAEDATR